MMMITNTLFSFWVTDQCKINAINQVLNVLLLLLLLLLLLFVSIAAKNSAGMFYTENK